MVAQFRLAAMKPIQDKITLILKDRFVTAQDGIKLESSLKTDLGLDSLDIIEFVLLLEDEFGIQISDRDADRLHTVEQIARLVKSKQA